MFTFITWRLWEELPPHNKGYLQSREGSRQCLWFYITRCHRWCSCLPLTGVSHWFQNRTSSALGGHFWGLEIFETHIWLFDQFGQIIHRLDSISYIYYSSNSLTLKAPMFLLGAFSSQHPEKLQINLILLTGTEPRLVELDDFWPLEFFWVVVSHLGKIPILTHIFQVGSNRQLVLHCFFNHHPNRYHTWFSPDFSSIIINSSILQDYYQCDCRGSACALDPSAILERGNRVWLPLEVWWRQDMCGKQPFLVTGWQGFLETKVSLFYDCFITKAICISNLEESTWPWLFRSFSMLHYP